MWQLGITYQKIDGVVDEQIDEPQEEWGILVIDVELGVFSEMQKSVKKTSSVLKGFLEITDCT